MNIEEKIRELEDRIKELEAENEKTKLHFNLVDVSIGLLTEGLKVVNNYFDRIFNKN